MPSDHERSQRLRRGGAAVFTYEEHCWLLTCVFFSLLNAVQQICGRAMRLRAATSLGSLYERSREEAPALLARDISIDQVTVFKGRLVVGVKALVPDERMQRQIWRVWRDALIELDRAPSYDQQCALLASPEL